MDVAIAALKSRFEQLQTYDTIFGFLFDSKKLNSLDDKLKECCINLENALKHDCSLDIDSNDLFFELKVLQVTLPTQNKITLKILEFVKALVAILMSQLLIKYC